MFFNKFKFPACSELNRFAGGMFHYRDGAATYGLKNNGMTLYKEDDDNLLHNYFGCYILDRLHKVQNMLEYALPPVCVNFATLITLTLTSTSPIPRLSKTEQPSTVFRRNFLPI